MDVETAATLQQTASHLSQLQQQAAGGSASAAPQQPGTAAPGLESYPELPTLPAEADIELQLPHWGDYVWLFEFHTNYDITLADLRLEAAARGFPLADCQIRGLEEPPDETGVFTTNRPRIHPLQRTTEGPHASQIGGGLAVLRQTMLPHEAHACAATGGRIRRNAGNGNCLYNSIFTAATDDPGVLSIVVG